MRQFSDAQKAKFKADWVKNYGHLVSKMLNTHRGEVQQAVRKVCKEYELNFGTNRSVCTYRTVKG